MSFSTSGSTSRTATLLLLDTSIRGDVTLAYFGSTLLQFPSEVSDTIKQFCCVRVLCCCLTCIILHSIMITLAGAPCYTCAFEGANSVQTVSLSLSLPLSVAPV